MSVGPVRSTLACAYNPAQRAQHGPARPRLDPRRSGASGDASCLHAAPDPDFWQRVGQVAAEHDLPALSAVARRSSRRGSSLAPSAPGALGCSVRLGTTRRSTPARSRTPPRRSASPALSSGVDDQRRASPAPRRRRDRLGAASDWGSEPRLRPRGAHAPRLAAPGGDGAPGSGARPAARAIWARAGAVEVVLGGDGWGSGPRGDGAGDPASRVVVTWARQTRRVISSLVDPRQTAANCRSTRRIRFARSSAGSRSYLSGTADRRERSCARVAPPRPPTPYHAPVSGRVNNPRSAARLIARATSSAAAYFAGQGPGHPGRQRRNVLPR